MWSPGRFVWTRAFVFLPAAAIGCAGDPGPETIPNPGKPGVPSTGFKVPEGAGAPAPAVGKAGPEAGLPLDVCTSGPNKLSPPASKVYYGTKAPSYVPLTAGQILAIGSFNGCSGTLIAPRWALSAKHCGLGTWSAFCIGKAPNNPNVCSGAKKVVNHPSADLALVELKHDMRALLPEVEPIPLMTEALGGAWVGRTAEAAGYGRQETGWSGEREFTAEPIVQVGSSTLTIDGEGQHGVCFGDSGGPVMVIAGDGTVRVAGALSNGDDSCVGWDHYARVDKQLAWIEGYTGPTAPPGPQPCGDVTWTGRCEAGGTRATWCAADGTRVSQTCPASAWCSWSASDDGFRCVDEAHDACQGVTWGGSCTANVLTWCDVGGLQTRDCGACGETCVPDAQWSWRCIPSTCGDVPFVAQCQGDTVVRCDQTGSIQQVDCAQYGDQCGYVNPAVGSWCVRSNTMPICGELSFYGWCDGSVVRWCNRDGVPESLDCAAKGKKCGWVDTETGFYCK